jgi:hypothetical protein
VPRLPDYADVETRQGLREAFGRLYDQQEWVHRR